MRDGDVSGDIDAGVRILLFSGGSSRPTIGVPIGTTWRPGRQCVALQATGDRGPCLTAAAAEPLVADLATIAALWPIFHQELLS